MENPLIQFYDKHPDFPWSLDIDLKIWKLRCREFSWYLCEGRSPDDQRRIRRSLDPLEQPNRRRAF